jgi:hypothetical protein
MGTRNGGYHNSPEVMMAEEGKWRMILILEIKLSGLADSFGKEKITPIQANF